MEIEKSSRHQKIIGDYGERLICNWLSRSGFEVTVVDHTGIDVIAYNRSTNYRLGITVKSRTRNPGKEETDVTIFRNKKNDRQKLHDACEAFECEPWIAVYVETLDSGDVYLTSLENYDVRYGGSNWKMGEKHRELYDKDPDVKHIQFGFHANNWFVRRARNVA